MKQLRAQDAAPMENVDSVALEARRVPLERKVILKFHHLDGFVIEYSANVSLTGMFICTESPKPPGSVFIFEIWLGDEQRLVHGLGEVIWTRESNEALDHPAGMGVRYLKMDGQSRAVVQRVISDHLERGGEPFDLESETAAATSGSMGSREMFSLQESDPVEGGSELLTLDYEELLMNDSDEERDPLERSLLKVSATPTHLRVVVFLLLLGVVGGLAYLLHVGGFLSP